MAEKWAGTGRKPNDSCLECNGSGWIITRDPEGRNYASRCRVCNDARAQRREILYKYSGLPRRSRANVAPCATAREYARAFPRLRDGNNWMMIIGKPGAGKTTQAIWLVCELIDRYSASARFHNAFDLVRKFVALRKRNEEFEREFDRYLAADLIVIDDFLKIMPSEKSFNYADYKETLLELIWARYDARKPLVITSQRDFDDIAVFDSALAGRIAEACEGRVVAFAANAVDWRTRRRQVA